MDTKTYWQRILEKARENNAKPCSVPMCTRRRQTKSVAPLCSMHITRLRITGSPVGMTLRANQYEMLSRRIRILFASNMNHVGLVTAERRLRHAMQDAKPYEYVRTKKVKNPEGRLLFRLREAKVPAVDILARAASIYCLNRSDPGLFEIRKGAVGDGLTYHPDQYFCTQLGRAVNKLMPNEKSAGGYVKHTPRRALEGFARWMLTEFTVFLEQTALAMDRIAAHAAREKEEALKPLALPEYRSQEWESLTDFRRAEELLEALDSATR